MAARTSAPIFGRKKSEVEEQQSDDGCARMQQRLMSFDREGEKMATIDQQQQQQQVLSSILGQFMPLFELIFGTFLFFSTKNFRNIKLEIL
ncbi:unnamed protein product [Gongylonema pulchrum]|uniref:Uncharacterized protein n=1 Tax=Gongylonema pulchrum TaxID=637853 RepID=A0A183D3H3_9BILA|nr:unnamed protein product [Gongylonema pulchrum]